MALKMHWPFIRDAGSLGSQLVLSLVQEAQRQHWPYVYLGYWVAQSRKMSYKARFKPLQFLGPNGWDWLE